VFAEEQDLASLPFMGLLMPHLRAETKHVLIEARLLEHIADVNHAADATLFEHPAQDFQQPGFTDLGG